VNNLIVECRGLCKDFNQHRALINLDLEVEKGVVFGLLGPNGSGKTTTIRIALGILNPDAGDVKVFGEGSPLSHRKRIGYLPEERGLYPRMKVREQLAFLGAIRGLDYKEADRRASSWLEKLGLADRAQARTNELSKGMQQKIQFASAVMHEPKLIVLDEPFTGLDPINARMLKELLLEQKDKGVTIILSTHRMDEVEAMCDSISLVHKGERVLHGKLSEIKASYGRNSVSIEYGGEPDCLKDLPGVLSVNDSGRSARFRLEKGADTQKLLRELLARTKIESFVVDEPHLEEIYLEKVGHSVVQTDSAGDFQPGGLF
jgi:ABC-2 type transport system ATP-binding protein